MFSELKVQLRNELQFVELSEVCSANKQFAQLRTVFTGKHMPSTPHPPHPLQLL